MPAKQIINECFAVVVVVFNLFICQQNMVIRNTVNNMTFNFPFPNK